MYSYHEILFAVKVVAWGSEDQVEIEGSTYVKGPLNYRYHDYDAWFMDLSDMPPDKISYYTIITTHVAIPLVHARMLVGGKIWWQLQNNNFLLV